MDVIVEPRRGFNYVRTSGVEERVEFVESLESEGYKPNEERGFTREDVLESNLPVTVDPIRKVYGRMGNVTCAAAAVTQKILVTVDEFYERG